MTTALITCGALTREVLRLVEGYGWDAQVLGVAAAHHLHPVHIAGAVEQRLVAARRVYARVIVIYGDCGTYGALDALLARYNVPRLVGAHCYAWYAGAAFEAYLAEEPGTYFLTDYLVRAFRGAVIKGMGLDRYPELKADYFRHYRRLLYLAQQPDAALLDQAQAIARYLELPLEVRVTGSGELETQLAALMAEPEPEVL